VPPTLGGTAWAASSPQEGERQLIMRDHDPIRGGGKKKPVKKRSGSDWMKGVNNLLAGAIAGASVESALYPIDTIKTRLQAMKGTPTGSLGAKLKLLRGKGSMYSGLMGNLAGVIPATAIFFGVYEPVKEKLLDPASRIPQWLAHTCAAASGALSASLVRVPTEVVKSRMQMGQFPSPLVALRSIIKSEGVGGIYAGFGSFIVRDLAFDIIEFVSYEQMKEAYLRKKNSARRVNASAKLDSDSNLNELKLSAFEGSVIGAVAGALTGTLTTPFDVIKTRLMLQGANKVYKGAFDCTLKMVTEEGAMALFKGVGPRVTWISIGGAVFFGALEKAKELLNALQWAREGDEQ